MIDLLVSIIQKKFGQDITCKKSSTAKNVLFVRLHPTLPYIGVRRNIIYISRTYNQCAGDTKIRCFLKLKKNKAASKY